MKRIHIMQEEGLDSYSYGDVDVTVTNKKKAKVVVGGKDGANGKQDDDTEE